jgi:hypothetical protein
MIANLNTNPTFRWLHRPVAVPSVVVV